MPAWLGVFFLLSGFSGLVYETVWLRLAMGGFGVTAPSVSLFLSVFMGGLGLGGWTAGALARRLKGLSPSAFLRLYGACELLIAACACAVPSGLTRAAGLLAHGLGAVPFGSAGYYAAACALIAMVLTPSCVLMGATFPLAMAAVERLEPRQARRSFSFFYLANVVGAAAGAFAGAFTLIELRGFLGAGLFAAAANACAGAGALALSAAASWSARGRSAAVEPRAERSPAPPAGARPLLLLATTGLSGMAMEVVWIREFTPFLGTTIYAFATTLFVYLVATFAGSWLYRFSRRRGRDDDALALVLAGPLALLPAAAADPYFPNAFGIFRVALGIAPVCAALGYLTPSLVDDWSAGEPARAGCAYAVNVAGCIAGPLLAGFALLPRVPERVALAVLALPLLAAGAAAARRPRAGADVRKVFGALALVCLPIVPLSSDFDRWAAEHAPNVQTARDYQADVLVAGAGLRKALLVNGEGMTVLTPVTKMMAHLPLAFLGRPAAQTLVICFGMGTTFRSLLSWGVPATAVELVPSVPRFFGFFHADAARVAASPGARIVIDDGRRFLARTRRRYDVITVDPPPPPVAAGSSLLYTTQFYDLAKSRLSPDGILQQWFLSGMDPLTTSAFAAALRDSFPYTKVFQVEGGYHVLARRVPIPAADAGALLRRMPAAAVADMGDFTPDRPPARVLEKEVAHEIPIDSLILPGGRPLTDNRPVNEYFFLRNVLPGVWTTLQPLARR